MSNVSKFIAVAPYGITSKDQHLIDDDAWYSAFLAKYIKSFVYIAGSYSANCLRETYRGRTEISIVQLSNMSGRFSYSREVVRRLSRELRSSNEAHIIFFGYSELMLFFAWPLLRLKKCHLTLVNTNNISQYRLDKYFWPMRFMHFLLSRHLARFIVHSQFEKKLVLSRFPKLADRTIVKKHHMMLPDSLASQRTADRKRINETIISCFGPITLGKSTEILTALIKQLQTVKNNRKYTRVRIYKIAPDIFAETSKKIKNAELSYSEVFLEADEYRRKIAESDLVVMNHTEDFEGRLSGIFCDCIALGTPYLALDIEPMLSYSRINNGLGFLLPRDDKRRWPTLIDAAMDPASLASMSQKIALISQEFEKKMLDEDYLCAFGFTAKHSEPESE